MISWTDFWSGRVLQRLSLLSDHTNWHIERRLSSQWYSLNKEAFFFFRKKISNVEIFKSVQQLYYSYTRCDGRVVKPTFRCSTVSWIEPGRVQLSKMWLFSSPHSVQGRMIPWALDSFFAKSFDQISFLSSILEGHRCLNKKYSTVLFWLLYSIVKCD